MRAPCSVAIALFLLCAACTTRPAFGEDGWGVRLDRSGGNPTLLSISEINAGTPPASAAVASVPVRERIRGRYRVAMSADRVIAARWTAGAALFDVELERALDWLQGLGADEKRGVELRITLMADHGARRQERSHRADSRLVIDLLVPVDGATRSRSATLETALATALHEAAHALNPDSGRERAADEYRASLVAACFRIDGIQPNDRISLAASGDAGRREFTRAHSREAALAVKHDLAAAIGASQLGGRDRAGIERLRAHCRAQLAMPMR